MTISVHRNLRFSCSAMAACSDSIPVDKVESLLCCSICLERVQDPRTLPCFHSYCKHCLENYVSKHRKKAAKGKKKIEEFECPSCRSLFSLKEHEEVANIRGSHFIRNMVDVLNAKREISVWKCSNHSEKPSCCRCVSCETFLCEECLKVHENWSTFKGHTVLTVEELQKPENQSKITDQIRCKEHTAKKLKFYCESCQVLICRYCMDFNHVRPDHLCHPIEKVAEKHRDALQSCCDALDEKQAEGAKSLKNITDAEEALKKTAENTKEEISKQKNNITKLVEDVFKSRINEVDQLYAAHKEELADEKKRIEFFFDKVKCAGNLSKNVLQKGSNEEIIESRKMVEERVEAVKKESEDVKKFSKPVGVKQSWFAAEYIDIEIITKLFGAVQNIEDFSDSTILGTREYARQMVRWFYKKSHKWQLCYRASRDGWYAEDFHRKCDNKGPTVVLVKVDDYIFGGFTEFNWKKDNVRGPKSSFVFSLKNNDDLPPFKSSILEGKTAICAGFCFGAVFGNGIVATDVDVFISKHPPTEKCYANLGHTYELPDGYETGSAKAGALLAGNSKFTPSEIEVFYPLKD